MNDQPLRQLALAGSKPDEWQVFVATHDGIRLIALVDGRRVAATRSWTTGLEAFNDLDMALSDPDFMRLQTFCIHRDLLL